MKKVILGLTAAIALSATQARAFEPSVVEIQDAMSAISRYELVQSVQNMINWQVGQFQDHNVKMIFGGGTSHKEASKEETAQNAIWLKTTISLLGQNQVSEALISRADGKVLKLIVNGKEEDPSDGKIEILEQAETNITVPAGTYECMYVKAKLTQKGQETIVQMWANPIDINLDGQLKAVIASQFGDITMELTKFGPK